MSNFSPLAPPLIDLYNDTFPYQRPKTDRPDSYNCPYSECQKPYIVFIGGAADTIYKPVQGVLYPSYKEKNKIFYYNRFETNRSYRYLDHSSYQDICFISHLAWEDKLKVIKNIYIITERKQFVLLPTHGAVLLH